MEYSNKESIAIRMYRIENFFYRHNVTVLAKLVYHMMQIFLGCTIPYSAQIDKGANIAHFHGIVIHQKSIVGEGTVLFQNVCLGGRNGKGGPVVGKNCIIGAGACVLGEISIGDNVNIGANSVVLESIPDGCTVVGIPGKIVKRE